VRGLTGPSKSFDEPLKSLSSALAISSLGKTGGSNYASFKRRDLCMAARHILEVEIGDFDDYHLSQLSSDFYRILYQMEKSNHEDTLNSLTKQRSILSQPIYSGKKHDDNSLPPHHSLEMVGSPLPSPQKKIRQSKKSTDSLVAVSDPSKPRKKMYSDYVGVTYNMTHSKFQACITHCRKQHYLGRFHLSVDAARAYDKGATELKGYGWKRNFRTDQEYERAKAKEMAANISKEVIMKNADSIKSGEKGVVTGVGNEDENKSVKDKTHLKSDKKYDQAKSNETSAEMKKKIGISVYE